MINKIIGGTLLAASLLVTTSYAAFAEGTEEGSVQIRAGVQGIFPLKKKSTMTAQNGTAVALKSKYDIGGEIAATYFFMDNIATELAAGYGHYKIKNTNVGEVYKIRTIPVSLTLQYHTPKINLFSFYLGAGWHYNYLHRSGNLNTSGGSYKIKNSNGPVLQLGTNMDLGSNIGLNLDYKQFFVKPKFQFQNYKISSSGPNSTVSKKDSLNPAVVTLGLSYTF